MSNPPQRFDATSEVEVDRIADDILELCAFSGGQFYEQGLHQDARIMFLHVVALNDKSYLGHAGLGALELLEGNDQAAREHLETAYARNPQDIVVCGNLGETLVRLGQVREAARFLREAAALDPAETNPYANRARAILAALPND